MKDCMSHFAFYCWSQSKEQIGSHAKAGQAAGMQHPQFGFLHYLTRLAHPKGITGPGSWETPVESVSHGPGSLDADGLPLMIVLTN